MLAFPTSLLCFHWQFKESRDTLWLLIQSPQTTSAQVGSEFTHNHFAMYMRGRCLLLYDLSQSHWNQTESLQWLLWIFWSGFSWLAKLCCLLADVREWSFNLHCRLFLPNSAVTLKTQDCKHRCIFLFAARNRALWIFDWGSGSTINIYLSKEGLSATAKKWNMDLFQSFSALC